MSRLPKEWWQLSWRWFFSSPAKNSSSKNKSFFKASLKVALLGMAAGVAALSLTTAVVSGYQEVVAKVLSKARGDLTVYFSWRDKEDLQKILQAAPGGWQKAQSLWQAQALLLSDEAAGGVLLEGLGPLTLKKAPEASIATLPALKLGKALADKLKLDVGDEARLLLPGLERSTLPIKVTDQISVGLHDLESRWAQLNDSSLTGWLKKNRPELLKKRPGVAHAIRFYMNEDFKGELGLGLLRKWQNEYNNNLKALYPEDNFSFHLWKDQKRNLFQSVAFQKKILVIMMGLLSLIAFLNMAAVLVVLFLERDREIALLQAIGASQAQLRRWIAIQGFILGLVVTALGLFLAVLLAQILSLTPLGKLPFDIYQIKDLPISFIFKEQLLIALYAVGSCVLIAVLLGRRLAKINLLEVLGHRR